MTMFNVWQGIQGTSKPLLILDHEGVVRWYYKGEPVYDDHRRLSNGNLLFTPDECVIMEVDILGNLIRSWYATKHPATCEVPSDAVPVEVDSFHHEISMLPNGNLLTLSTEARQVDDFPTSEDNRNAGTETALVIGSAIVEFTPDGEVLKYIPLSDLLDPTRIGRGTLNPNWGLILRYRSGTQTPRDWDHANAVIYEASSDAYYVSVRHQDAVIKVNRTDETLEWILGTPSNWESPWNDKLLSPLGNLEWPYHKHAVVLTPDGLGLYDNGNYRAAAYETVKTEWSRAVLFSIDEEAMTVEEHWRYGDPSGQNSFYSSAMGDADRQPETGNVLMVNGLLEGNNGSSSQILEVSESGTRVFELNVRGTGVRSDFAMHRAKRIPDLRQ